MSPPPIEHKDPLAPPAPPAADGAFVATVRIDAQPGGKRFQGVWLVHGGAEWVVDYRARELWQPFDGLEVRVTGETWTPDPRAQAIQAQHFKVARLEVADPAKAKRFRAIGPERELSGVFVHKRVPAGAKGAGASPLYFEEKDGQRYEVIGGEHGSGAATVVARDVEINPTWAATTGGPFLWIETVR